MCGAFTAIDALAEGTPLPFCFIVSRLGLCLHADVRAEQGTCTDDTRQAACRKRLAVYEAPPSRAQGIETLVKRVRELNRFAATRDMVPLAMSRLQFAGTEELCELVCTVHVINHAGQPWSCV